MAYRKSKRSRQLVSKSGKINAANKKNINDLINQIESRDDYTPAEKTTLVNRLKAEIKQRQKENRGLTINGFFGMQESEKINRLLRNAGYSPEEMADELGIDIDTVLDETNWKDDTFIDPVTGAIYDVNFNYTGSILVRR